MSELSKSQRKATAVVKKALSESQNPSATSSGFWNRYGKKSKTYGMSAKKRKL